MSRLLNGGSGVSASVLCSDSNLHPQVSMDSWKQPKLGESGKERKEICDNIFNMQCLILSGAC